MRIPACLGMLLAAWLLAACGDVTPASERPHYVTTIHPFQAILEPVVGARGTVSKLLPPGASPHTHDLRPSDVRGVEGCAAVLYGAAHLDEWAADLDAPAHVALLDLVPDAFRLPLPPDDAGTTRHAGIDPHFWSDPLAVKAMLPALTDTLCALDAGGCAAYRANADAFAAELDALHEELRVMLEPVQGTPVMLAQPFFQYFLKRYRLHLVAVVEPMPGKEATPRALQRLVAQAQAEQVAAIFTKRQLPPRSARAVGEAAGIALHELDPLGGVKGRETYTELLRYNARVIRVALAPVETFSDP